MSALLVARAEIHEPPAQWHRVLTLLADVSLFIGTRAVWTQAATHKLVLAAVISVCYASILVTGVLTLTVRRARSLARLDAVVLVTAIALTLCGWALNHAGGDEAVLTTQAAHQIAHGHQVYDQPWPWLFRIKGVALTATTTGGYDFTYGYPPLAPLLTVPFLWLGHAGCSGDAGGDGRPDRGHGRAVAAARRRRGGRRPRWSALASASCRCTPVRATRRSSAWSCWCRW